MNHYAPPPDENFYAAPTADVRDVSNNAESLREEFVLHEQSLRSVGWLFMIGGIISVPWGGAALVTNLAGQAHRDPDARAVGITVGAVMVGMGLLNVWIGNGLRTFNPKIKIPAVIVSGISLLSIPCGTAFGAYTMYLVLSAKGTMVFSDEYKAAIAATPHIKARTPWYAWALLLLLVLLIGLAVVGISRS